MPPKKKGGKSKGGKSKGDKKKGSSGKGPQDFEEILNERFYMSPEDKEKKRLKIQADIRKAFALFERDQNGTCDVRELGTIVRSLGFNPTERQLRAMQEQVEDDETATFIIASKFEKMMLDIFLTFEFKYRAPKPPASAEVEQGGGKPGTLAPVVDDEGYTRDLMVRDREGLILSAFHTVWRSKEKKIDAENQRYIDSDALRDLFLSHGAEECFNESEAMDMINAAADPETGFIKEEYVANLAHD